MERLREREREKSQEGEIMYPSTIDRLGSQQADPGAHTLTVPTHIHIQA